MTSEYIPPKTCEIFEIIRASAMRKDLMTYGEVAERVDLLPHWLAQHLGRIWRWCEAKGMPHLNAIVVQKYTRFPGHGYRPQDREVTWDQHQQIKAQIFAYNWTSVRFP